MREGAKYPFFVLETLVPALLALPLVLAGGIVGAIGYVTFVLVSDLLFAATFTYLPQDGDLVSIIWPYVLLVACVIGGAHWFLELSEGWRDEKAAGFRQRWHTKHGY